MYSQVYEFSSAMFNIFKNIYQGFVIFRRPILPFFSNFTNKVSQLDSLFFLAIFSIPSISLNMLNILIVYFFFLIIPVFTVLVAWFHFRTWLFLLILKRYLLFFYLLKVLAMNLILGMYTGRRNNYSIFGIKLKQFPFWKVKWDKIYDYLDRC